MNLVIVESGAKAKTIQKYLGAKYVVKSCYGHIQKIDEKADLTKSDGDNLPEPKWIFINDRATKFIKETKQTIKKKKITTIYVATDPDREGELIAWRLSELLGKLATIKRMVFQEITPNAIQNSLKEALQDGSIDMHMVWSALVRTFMDRLVGFGASNYLQRSLRKLKKRGLSMGRVQTPTLGFVLERESKINAHKPEKYYEFHILANNFLFKAVFQNPYKKNKHQTKNHEEVKAIEGLLKGKGGLVLQKVKSKNGTSKAPLPFSTDTFIQAAGNQGISPKAAMAGAQKLYQSGLITYMRTDSTRINPSFKALITENVKTAFGEDYLSPKSLKSSKSGPKIQDAHEAIRATTLKKNPGGLESNKRIYDLILKRTIASQMVASKHKSFTLLASLNGEVNFVAKQTYITFSGYQAAYGKKPDKIPGFGEGENLKEMSAKKPYGLMEKETKPPARFKQYTLIQKMKDTGIGRPSTYVPTVEKLSEREYVKIEKGNIFPQPIAPEVMKVAASWGNKDAGHLFNPDFTKSFEGLLDQIENGSRPEPIWGMTRNYFKDLQDRTNKQITPSQKNFLETKMFPYAAKNKNFWKRLIESFAEDKDTRFALEGLMKELLSKNDLDDKLKIVSKKAGMKIIGFTMEDEGFSDWANEESKKKGIKRPATKKQINFILSLGEKKKGANKLIPKNLDKLEIGDAVKLIKNLLSLADIPGKETKLTKRQLNAVNKLCKTLDVTTEKALGCLKLEKKTVEQLSVKEASKVLELLFSNVKKQKKNKAWKFDCNCK